MKQPLVLRPGYGRPSAPSASSKMPEGDPATRGLPLGEDVPGHQTFTKPLDDHGTSDSAPEQSLYRVDGPRDWAKKQDGGDDTIDQSHSSPAYMGLGDKDPNDYSKTKYPYRDGKPNTHNAAKGDPKIVAALYMLAHKEPLVIPYQDFRKYAYTAEQILSNLNPKVLDRSRKSKVDLKRADVRNLRWIFNVTGNDTYTVKLKALRPRRNVTKLSKMDLEISCTCPAWQWQGPAFHATTSEYQLGKAPGTASTPDIRDPNRVNKVCKHVAAVLDATRGWDVPARSINKQAVHLAVKKRACNVYLAQEALTAGEQGRRIVWGGSPDGTSPVYVRALGAAEFKPAKYQLRREGEVWPSTWIPSSDLAGSLGRLGFDSRWDYVPSEVRAWALEGAQI